MTRPSQTSQLIFWILGALLMFLGITTQIAHSVIMRQLDVIERRLESLEKR